MVLYDFCVERGEVCSALYDKMKWSSSFLRGVTIGACALVIRNANTRQRRE